MNLFDLHIHSNFSFDCDVPVENIVEKLIKKGYTGFSITDHNTIKHLEYIERLNIKELIFVPGFEWTVDGFDLLCYNIRDLPPDNISLTEVIEWVKSRGGKIVLAHPARYLIEITSSLLSIVDGLELINRRYSRLATEFENRYHINFQGWCKKQEKALFGNSDAHTLKDLGMVGTYIPARNLDEFVWAVENRLCFPVEKSL
ncbi:MAG: PHP domain-containing protein [Planctomycetota bacterium]